MHETTVSFRQPILGATGVVSLFKWFVWMSNKFWGCVCSVFAHCVSCECLCVCCSRAGHKQGVVSLPLVLVAWNKSSVVGRSCDCVRSTLVMWSEHRAGSEKCWVALWGSFYLEKQAASEHAGIEGRRAVGRRSDTLKADALFKSRKTAMVGAFLVWVSCPALSFLSVWILKEQLKRNASLFGAPHLVLARQVCFSEVLSLHHGLCGTFYDYIFVLLPSVCRTPVRSGKVLKSLLIPNHFAKLQIWFNSGIYNGTRSARSS